MSPHNSLMTPQDVIKAYWANKHMLVKNIIKWCWISEGVERPRSADYQCTSLSPVDFVSSVPLFCLDWYTIISIRVNTIPRKMSHNSPRHSSTSGVMSTFTHSLTPVNGGNQTLWVAIYIGEWFRTTAEWPNIEGKASNQYPGKANWGHIQK